jgi:hypothetical protein
MDTEYAGLPKATKVFCAAVQGLAAGFATVAMDTLKFNYGGYTYLTGGVGFPYTTIVVPEPGIYDLKASGQVVAGNMHFYSFNVNGALGVAPYQEYGVTTVLAGAPFNLGVVTGAAELKAGDTVAVGVYNDVAAVNTVANTFWLYVEKRGGQY